MSHTMRARTARVARICSDDRTQIRPGHRYLRLVLFPGEINTSGVPWVAARCVRCAVERGEHFEADACASYCHGTEPCALRFKHTGEHRCHHCPESSP
jgi:hypothetical protein